MPIATKELKRDFVVVDEGITVGQVRDQVANARSVRTYIIVRLVDGRYAVLRLDELIHTCREGVFRGRHVDAARRNLRLLMQERKSRLDRVIVLDEPFAPDGVDDRSNAMCELQSQTSHRRRRRRWRR